METRGHGCRGHVCQLRAFGGDPFTAATLFSGRRIRTKNCARHWMHHLCSKLNLKLHGVVGAQGMQSRMYGPIDIEGHCSMVDGRFYLLDTGMLGAPSPGCV